VIVDHWRSIDRPDLTQFSMMDRDPPRAREPAALDVVAAPMIEPGVAVDRYPLMYPRQTGKPVTSSHGSRLVTAASRRPTVAIAVAVALTGSAPVR
jgi:hypothetical protein